MRTRPKIKHLFPFFVIASLLITGCGTAPEGYDPLQPKIAHAQIGLGGESYRVSTLQGQAGVGSTNTQEDSMPRYFDVAQDKGSERESISHYETKRNLAKRGCWVVRAKHFRDAGPKFYLIQFSCPLENKERKLYLQRGLDPVNQYFELYNQTQKIRLNLMVSMYSILRNFTISKQTGFLKKKGMITNIQVVKPDGWFSRPYLELSIRYPKTILDEVKSNSPYWIP